ncbi:calexcitin-2-like [Babylonia areolata]|uniref:calexcitin-2-like n=1 Tax=Babylonia areolata TaxID=304850 RepID=UPI003FD02D55
MTTMSLTEFQKEKVINVFERLYDSNKDGVIDQKDFSDAIDKISKLHHWGKDDNEYKKAKDKLALIWDGLREGADKNKDGIVTKEEWVNMWAKTLDNIQAGQPFPKWQETYMEFMFYANDTSGDGFIDKGEYVAIQTIFGNKEDDSKKAFDVLVEGNEQNLISKTDFEQLWHQYFLSTNASDKGNYLFGTIPKTSQ